MADFLFQTSGPCNASECIIQTSLPRRGRSWDKAACTFYPLVISSSCVEGKRDFLYVLILFLPWPAPLSPSDPHRPRGAPGLHSLLGTSQLCTQQHQRTPSPCVPRLVIPAKRQLQLFEDFRAAQRPHERDEGNNQESVTGEHFHSCLPGQVSPGECFACSAASEPLRTQKQQLQPLLSPEQ